MENQFGGNPENSEQDEFLSFLDTRPLQETPSAAITPQAILARSSIHTSNSNLQSVSPASVMSPIMQTQTMPAASSSSQQALSAATTPQQVLTQSIASQQPQLQQHGQSHNQVPSVSQSGSAGPSQASTQAPTPQAILSNTNTLQDPQPNNTSARSSSGFADRTAMFAALQQRQHQQRQKLQMMQQAVSRTGSPQEANAKRPSVEPHSQSSSTGQVPQAQPSIPPTNSLPPTQQRQAIQNLDPEVQRRVSAELNNKQFELFMKSLVESCKRRNAPLHSFPEIRGRRINLFVLYSMVQKLGGGESVTRLQQWPMLAQKLQLPDDASQQLAALYYHLLVPYEQYLASPEGIKETQAKRLFLQQFLQELLKKIMVPQPSTNSNEAVMGGFAAGIRAETPDANKVKKPRKPKTKKKSKKDLEKEMRHQQEQLQKQHEFQQEQQGRLLQEQRAKQQQEQMRLRQQMAVQQSIEYQKLPKVYKRSFARNYVPSSRAIETSNGYDMRAVSQIGEKIDANKPVFLFAPELGTINLHALSLSLLSGCVSEVNVALNTLLVTSADSILEIPLDRFQGLIDSLAILGCQLLNKLCLSEGSVQQENDNYLNTIDVQSALHENTKYSRANNTLDKVFSANSKDYSDEEVIIKVDSLTGVDLQQSVLTPESTPTDDFNSEDDDRQSKEKDSFNEKSWHYLPEALCLSDDIENCKLNVPSYLSSLRDIRDEVDTLFTKVNTRGAENYQLMVVDQLSTISMIVRNLSFREANTSPIATNTSFKRFLNDLIWCLFLRSDKFLFHRKCLNFKKDMIITLANVSHLLQVEDHVTTCLLIFLILSFSEGKGLAKADGIEPLEFSEYPVKLSNYQTLGVDVLAKLLSLGYPNRLLFKAVFLQQFETDPHSQDVITCKKLIALYEATASQKYQGFSLLHDTFASLVSIIPFQQLNISPNLIEEVGPTISQGVTALLSLARFCRKDSLPKGAPNMPLLWLTSEENVGSSLRRLSEALSNLGIHTNNNLSHLKNLFHFISAKCLQLVTSLIEQALDLADERAAGDQATYRSALESLNGVANLLPSEQNLFTLLTNPMADYMVARETGELHRLRARILSDSESLFIANEENTNFRNKSRDE
ncbi:LAME_0H09340g1_1 [Lachancea meyersii CBS 8951]|uniref:LAME_0H09340g1_1 n=1 Tax=Lachancea meyersii CBS 8951 TaxID=1266667 RepID=A0A1G4KFX0_9SACH|nr:LAME_0H09340g1_1 [Lachancea meyersii CBS 8951]